MRTLATFFALTILLGFSSVHAATVTYTVPSFFTIVHDGYTPLCSRGITCNFESGAVYTQVTLTATGRQRAWISCVVGGCTAFATPALAAADQAVPGAMALFANVDTAGNLDARDTVTTPLAFPGATGPAKEASGGRGGTVYTVNTTTDPTPVSGDGLISFREAYTATGDVSCGARNIIFSVSGEVFTGTTFAERIDTTCGNMTIYGQSAPAPGIVFTGQQPLVLTANADNVIIRFLDIKPLDTLNAGDNTAGKIISLRGSAGGVAPDNIMIDHISGLGSTDEGISFYANTTVGTGVVTDMTISHSIFGEGATTCLRNDFECGTAASQGSQGNYSFPNHSMAIYLSANASDPIERIGIIANVMTNTVSRAPFLRSVRGGEVINNLIANNYGLAMIYNNTTGPAAQGGSFEGNVFKHGPDTNDSSFQLNSTYVYGTGLVVRNNTEYTYAGATNSLADFGATTYMAEYPRTSLDGNTAINLACAGASVPTRDTWDTRVIAEINGNGPTPMLASAEIGIGPRQAWNATACGTDPGDGSRSCFYFDPDKDIEGNTITATGFSGSPITVDQGQRDYRSYASGLLTSHTGDAVDTDGDGVSDGYEARIIAAYPSMTTTTVNSTSDTDGDGYSDFEEEQSEKAASCALNS